MVLCKNLPARVLPAALARRFLCLAVAGGPLAATVLGPGKPDGTRQRNAAMTQLQG